MRKQVRRRHEAHLRAQTLCAEHRAFFDATPGGQKARADLGTQMADVDRLLALQEQSIDDGRGATVQRRLARRRLREAAAAVVRVGRVVNLAMPVLGALRLPDATSDDELLAYARGLLERVSAHADAFVAEGLPPDLLKHLGEAVAGFAAAREEQAASAQRFTGASELIRETLDQADKTVDVLEAIVINTAGAAPDLRTKLRIARRVGPRVSPPVPKPPQVPPADKAA